MSVHNATLAGRYRIMRELARGGMGIVYQVQHITTGRLHAAKVLPQTGSQGSHRDLERFQREARSSTRIESPFVVQISDADLAPELGDVAFVVMELLEGSDLATLVDRRGRLSRVEVIAVMAQIASGLTVAHGLGIVHRDIKPANLFLHQKRGGQALIKILDFGLATAARDLRDSRVTAGGEVLGTPAYMAPEQAHGRQAAIQPATDIWALGITAFELLTGQMYWGDFGAVEIMRRLLRGQLTLPSEVVAGCGQAFDAWFVRSCQPEPTKRFASAQEQLVALGQALGVALPDVHAPLPATLWAADRAGEVGVNAPTAVASSAGQAGPVAGASYVGGYAPTAVASSAGQAGPVAGASYVGGYAPTAVASSAGQARPSYGGAHAQTVSSPSVQVTPQPSVLPAALSDAPGMAPPAPPATASARRGRRLAVAAAALLWCVIALAVWRPWQKANKRRVSRSSSTARDEVSTKPIARTRPPSAGRANSAFPDDFDPARPPTNYLESDGRWIKHSLVRELGEDAELISLTIHATSVLVLATTPGNPKRMRRHYLQFGRWGEPTSHTGGDLSALHLSPVRDIDFSILPLMLAEAEQSVAQKGRQAVMVVWAPVRGQPASWTVFCSSSSGNHFVTFDRRGKVVHVAK